MKKPRILLVQPTTVHLDGTPHKTRWRLIMGLMIPLMAGLTPPEYDVTLCDERLEDLDFDAGFRKIDAGIQAAAGGRVDDVVRMRATAEPNFRGRGARCRD